MVEKSSAVYYYKLIGSSNIVTENRSASESVVIQATVYNLSTYKA